MIGREGVECPTQFCPCNRVNDIGRQMELLLYVQYQSVGGVGVGQATIVVVGNCVFVDMELTLGQGDQWYAGFRVGHCLVVLAGKVVCYTVEALWNG